MRITRDQENHELNMNHRSTSPVSSATPKKLVKTALESKLEQLEKKQYELTKKVRLLKKDFCMIDMFLRYFFVFNQIAISLRSKEKLGKVRSSLVEKC
jgi:hypothetical protein